MTSKDRYYKSGVREALFMLSRGRCYAPKCPQRVLRIVDDDPSINIQVAHINGLKPGSARYDESIPVQKRNSFGNLLLLCQAHHRPVDDKYKEDQYPKELLLEWKKEREGAAYQQLAGLDILGRDDLEAMLVSVVSDTKQEILSAIDEVATISKGAADTLRKLVAESFDWPYLDLDAVAMLADSAAALRHLPDSAAVLSDAAGVLRNLDDSASTLSDAARDLHSLEDNVSTLRSAATDLSSAVEGARSIELWDVTGPNADVETASLLLSEAISRVETAAQSLATTDVHTNDPRNWLFFKWGLGVGAGVVLAVIVFILIYIHKGG